MRSAASPLLDVDHRRRRRSARQPVGVPRRDCSCRRVQRARSSVVRFVPWRHAHSAGLCGTRVARRGAEALENLGQRLYRCREVGRAHRWSSLPGPVEAETSSAGRIAGECRHRRERGGRTRGQGAPRPERTAQPCGPTGRKRAADNAIRDDVRRYRSSRKASMLRSTSQTSPNRPRRA
jgi:hypothetical protein